ncbi:uncharacterized protein BP01DRAFT_402015 [Aspergillus saccharolyticus JOP 1030-1]|uniref:Uncharacterized protein n=1 Tax=Aspergillus saccharolyticus JOP 1030-1 TaxID=1450539 RepID=A0A319AAP5_9EURO|nr:hypothetical protein BP01DRAFT_402015 [Aspergillus saccharolyticus JOP 1030-1]PYH44012.1 hypothetical protein BP01DRAFT_402015 [Aspergillus saccharolyticus JOP 1030-1]
MQNSKNWLRNGRQALIRARGFLAKRVRKRDKKNEARGQATRRKGRGGRERDKDKNIQEQQQQQPAVGWPATKALPKTVTFLTCQLPVVTGNNQQYAYVICLSDLLCLFPSLGSSDITQRVFPPALHSSSMQIFDAPSIYDPILHGHLSLHNNAISSLNYINAFLLLAGAYRGWDMYLWETRRATRNRPLQDAKPRDHPGRYTPPFRWGSRCSRSQGLENRREHLWFVATKRKCS